MLQQEQVVTELDDIAELDDGITNSLELDDIAELDDGITNSLELDDIAELENGITNSLELDDIAELEDGITNSLELDGNSSTELEYGTSPLEEESSSSLEMGNALDISSADEMFSAEDEFASLERLSSVEEEDKPAGDTALSLSQLQNTSANTTNPPNIFCAFMCFPYLVNVDFENSVGGIYFWASSKSTTNIFPLVSYSKDIEIYFSLSLGGLLSKTIQKGFYALLSQMFSVFGLHFTTTSFLWKS